jgi:CubicO group peptidase (beta-lactamase class C family)/cyclophilin family peptidyl-prolyl cis-trans isomerase
MPTSRACRLACLALSLLAVAPPAGARSQDVRAGEFDAYVARAVTDWHAPGLAIAVVKDGQVLVAKGYGVRDIGQPGAVDANTLFAIGSTTKAMTAAAIGMLVDEGKLAWDDPVTRHLPGFAVADAYVTRELRIRDLLTHRSGLAQTDFLWYGQERRSIDDVLRRLQLVTPSSSLRSHFAYQNVMYAAAGEVVARVSGMPWAEFVRRRIFTPLGMTRSVASLGGVTGLDNVAVPHFELNGRVAQISNASADAVPAAGAVWSSAADMARWVAYLLSEHGDPAVPQLLAPGTKEELFRPQFVVDEGFYPTARLTRPHWTTYGLGWFQQDYAGYKVDFHTGSIDGMAAIAGLIRDERLGVVVLSNLEHMEARHALMFRAFDTFLGRDARDWSTEFQALYRRQAEEQQAALQRLEAKRVPGTRPTLTLARYAGTYGNAVFGDLGIKLEDEALRLRFGDRSARLEHWHYDIFRIVWDRAWQPSQLAEFSIDADADVSRVEVGGLRFDRVPERAQAAGAAPAANQALPVVDIVTEAGTIRVQLDPARAPKTVENFLRYVRAGFFDGTSFYRTVTMANQPDNPVRIEVIQGGADDAKEAFPPIALERTSVTGLRHVDGAISMARDGPDTATSEFFICVGDQPELDFGGRRNPDGQGFAAFGHVIAGMDVVRRIHTGPVIEQRLAPPVRILSIALR